MRVRVGLAAVLIGSLGVSAMGVAASAGSAVPRDVPDQVDEAVTVSGEFSRMVVDTTDGEVIRYGVRNDDESWWLDGVAEPAPSSGSQVTVTGTPLDQYTLRVDAIQVTSAAAEVSGTAALAPRSTRVLVMRAFWGPQPPARPTLAETKRKVLGAGNAWFREVSHRRYSISGAVTPWLRVRRPQSCYQGSFAMMNEALSAAQRRGFNLSRFQRALLYVPCNAGGVLGVATVPGQHVWVFNNLRLNVLVHEQGHNLGLFHAGARDCRSPKWGGITWGPNCRVIEYGDEIDTMGNRRPGHFNGFYKSQLGWLQRGATVTSTRRLTLRPYETIGPGVKAIRVRAGRATFWLEYRTRTGHDRTMPRGTAGVQIRFQRGVQTQLLDAGPGSPAGFYDFVDTHLPVGSSWTTPQNVRITVVGQRPLAATVAIKFRAGPARAPSRPSPVRARALDDAARITWTRPPDNGAIIRHYVIRRLEDGATRLVRTFAGLRTSYIWRALNPNRTFTFAVRAVNQAGQSLPGISPPVNPL